MADGFLCDVLSPNVIDGTWDVKPKLVEIDGTDAKTIKAKPVGGIEPTPGDVALVVLPKNNLDDGKISRWYEATDANARIVAIATPVLRYEFKGDYKFEGDIIIDGNLEITGNLDVGGDVSIGTIIQPGNLDVTGDLEVDGNLDVNGDLDVDGETNTASLKINGIDWLQHTHSGVTPGGGSTGAGAQI